MTNSELSQLFDLKNEIHYLQCEIQKVSLWRLPPECKSLHEELLSILRQRLDRCMGEYDRCIQFIDAIPDEWTRRAFRLRYVQRRSWAIIGVEMGLTSDCCRQMVHRYIKAAAK